MPDIALLTEPRRGILTYLGTEHTAGQVTDHLAGVMTRSAVSQHLQMLLDAKLVSCRRDGRERWYRADRWAMRDLFLETWAALINGEIGMHP